MLFLLLFLHAFSANGRPQVVPEGPHLGPRAPADSCDDINNCRKLFDVIWSCLAAIFAWSWVAVHPNVPAPNKRTFFWRRLRMMLVGVLAPQLIVSFAARQFFAARWYARSYNISTTHGYFICMGGFVSRAGHPVTTAEQFEGGDGPRYLEDIRAVNLRTINDKSKKDAVAIGIAAHALWIMIQCIARTYQHLPITLLETVTVAFCSINALAWGLWWEKPLDVEEPIVVGPQEVSDGEAQPNLADGPREKSSAGGAKLWRGAMEEINAVLTGRYDTYEPTSSTSVPAFWSRTRRSPGTAASFFMECVIGAYFGTIHFTAWKADFPSAYEMWMWKSCSVLITVIPILLLFFAAVTTIPSHKNPVAECIGTVMSTIFILIYIIARLFLIVLPLVSLRALPRGALADVDWSVFIPHL
ncbi:hypothetical protein B0H13DRAFT_2336891 [Mycena leptocephala]|nr:hypothetical protein B0H13DRAFT_2336891 [Mycena leptocephala]